MRNGTDRSRWCHVVRSLAAASAVALVAGAAVGASAQGRWGGDRGRSGGGDSGGRDTAPSRGRDYSPPPGRGGGESAPRREYNPPTRRDDGAAPRREYNPPTRRDDNPTPRRDYSPPVRRDDSGSPSRWGGNPPTRRDGSGTPSRWGGNPPARREDPVVQPWRPGNSGQRRWQYNPSPRDEGSSPRRGNDLGLTPGDRGPRDSGTSPRRGNDLGLNPGERSPRGYDFGLGPGDRGSRDSGSGRGSGTDRAPRRDGGSIGPNPGSRSGGDRGPGDVFDRRGRQGGSGSGQVIRPGGGSTSGPRDGYAGRGGTDWGRGGRTDYRSGDRNEAYRIFTRSREGRRYNNGLYLRPGIDITHDRVRSYFREPWAFYPYYAPAYEVGFAYYSPYSFYFGVCPPYIYRRHTWFFPPSVIYVEVPVYVGDDCRGYDGDLDDYYIDRSSRYYDDAEIRDAGLQDAIERLRSGFRWGQIDDLVELTDPQVRIAVYLRGKYDYSLSAEDYLDMTRDALRNMDTVAFDLYRVRRRTPDVYVVSGRHVYRDNAGTTRTVYVSYVLERYQGRWTLTQVGTAPDRGD